MYFFTAETIAQANKNVETLDPKVGGLFCILYCLSENIEENVSYTIDGERLRRQLSMVFDKEPKDSFEAAKPSYIIFARDWVSTFFDIYIKTKIDLLSCAVFFLRRHSFDKEYTNEEIIDIFVKEFNLENYKSQWFDDGNKVNIEYNQSFVEDNQAEFYIKMNYVTDFKSILFNNVIKKSAADLKAAGQIQTLYSGSNIHMCFLLSDEPLDKFYILSHKSDEELMDASDGEFTAEWFASKAKEYPDFDEEAGKLLKAFEERFSPDKLIELSGEDVLTNIFLNDKNADNLCRVLEFSTEYREYFGSIKGGSSYKYGLYFASDGKWTGGSHHNPEKYTLEEAIEIGTNIRDRLVAGAKAIAEFGEISTIDDYKRLYAILRDVTEGDIDRAWFLKYYQMLFPNYFAPDYSDYAQRTVLDTLGISKEKYALVRMGQIKLFADRCGISNVVFNKVFWDNYVEVADAKNALVESEIAFKTGYQSNFPRNRILFGAPGTGKSYTLNQERELLLSEGGEYERVTFHPDYSYANFVGTYKPVPCENNDGDAITYSYVPGPFMRTYVKALKNSRTDSPKPHLLVIEEINRANVAAVFGDVFQLLDRGDDEVSEYPIQASEDIRKYLAKELGGDPDSYSEIKIPDNMFIWATMNSADQGVFPMDTAFKRRWDFTYLGIDDSEDGIKGKKVVLGKGQDCRVVEWNNLRKAINSELLKYKVNEDKLMGPYFIAKKNLPEGQDIDASSFIRIFKNKVIMYLFDDAAKQKRQSLFAGCDEEARNQYSKICKTFEEKGVHIFCDNIADKFTIRPEDEDK